MKIKRISNYEINDIKVGDIIALNVWLYHETEIKIGTVSGVSNNEVTILTDKSIEYTENMSSVNIEKTIELNSNDYLNQLEEIELDLKHAIKIIDLRLTKIRDHFSLKGKYTMSKRITEIKDYLKITSLDHVIDKISYTIDYYKHWYRE